MNRLTRARRRCDPQNWTGGAKGTYHQGFTVVATGRSRPARSAAGIALAGKSEPGSLRSYRQTARIAVSGCGRKACPSVCSAIILLFLAAGTSAGAERKPQRSIPRIRFTTFGLRARANAFFVSRRLGPDPFSTPPMRASRSRSADDFVGGSEAGRVIDAEACNSWTESGVHSPTVSAKRLAVPGNASSEYQKACGAFKGQSSFQDSRRSSAQGDRMAYPDYAAAWVVLGQVLDVREKAAMTATAGACSKRCEIDPGYVASVSMPGGICGQCQ